MDTTEYFQPGMRNEKTYAIEDEHTAIHVGSGASRVLATPWMIAFMERVSHQLLARRLPEGYSSVGVLVNVRHLAPTPVGENVRITAEITAIDGSHITFSVQAWDNSEQVGSGQHERVVIDEARFLRRVSAKREAAAS
jgi:fluoroacetyl-CoA thioesterase